jgi:outer membrane protein OmpA-like peptidoglycan-associated protein
MEFSAADQYTRWGGPAKRGQAPHVRAGWSWHASGFADREEAFMKLSHTIAPALAALLLAACASHETHASAPERAQQAEEDKQHADDSARQARIDAENARINAQDAARAQHEADVKAQYAAQEAAQAERDAQQPAYGVAEPQGVDGREFAGPDSGVWFATRTADLTGDDKARLDDLAASLRAHPSRTVVIKGWADDSGVSSTDAQLSQRRADAVAHYLDNRGVSGDRIVTKVGTWNGTTTDDAGRRRALHHRLEIFVK